jgi:hypothetical protein
MNISRYFFYQISFSYSSNEKWDTTFRENEGNRFLFNNVSRKLCGYEHATVDNMVREHCMPANYSYMHTPHKHTHTHTHARTHHTITIDDTYCFSTTNLVARTRLHVNVRSLCLIICCLYGLGNDPVIYQLFCVCKNKQKTLRSCFLVCFSAS